MTPRQSRATERGFEIEMEVGGKDDVSSTIASSVANTFGDGLSRKKKQPGSEYTLGH